MASASEQQLKSALAAGDFTQVQHLLPAYTDEIGALFAGRSSREERRQALEAFHNLLSLARVMRAHIGAQLSKLQRQSRYRYQTPSAEEHSWRFEA